MKTTYFLIMRFSLFCVFYCILTSFAQGQQYLSKQIQSFDFWSTNTSISDASNCWIHDNLSYNANGNILSVKAVTDRMEGDASHEVSYEMRDLDANIVITRPYGAYPRDFSFEEGGISFWVKGEKGNNDEVRVILYEGKNAYTKPNEIFHYYVNQNNPTEPKILSNSEWTKVSIPFSYFTLFYDNGGDGKLNLDRIGQVDIQIINKTHFNHSSSFCIDDLRWETTATPSPESNQGFRSIILPLHVRDNAEGKDNWHNWTVEEWMDEMARMATMGIEKITIQYTQVIYDSKDIYDTNSNLGRYNNAASYLQPFDPQSSHWVIKSYTTLNTIFDAAIRLKEEYHKEIKIELGLAHYEPYWNVNTAHYGEPFFYDHMYKHVKASIDDLSNLLKQSEYQAMFAGWYIPQEFNEVYWDTNNKVDLLADYYVKICDYIRTKDRVSPISMAPFFYGYVSVSELSELYSRLFRQINENKKRVNLLYIQDGIGVGEHRVGIDLKQFVPPIKDVLKNTGGTELGIVIESFDAYDCQGRDTTNIGSIPKISRIRRQLSDALDITQDINKISVFSWADFQSTYTSIDRDSESLYQDYLKCFPAEFDSPYKMKTETQLAIIDQDITSTIDMTSNTVTLNVSNPSNEMCNVSILSMQGSVVYNEPLQMYENQKSYVLHLQNSMTADIYLIMINGKKMKRMTKHILK